MSKIEKGQLYIAIGIFMLGYMYDIRSVMALSAGIFLGMGCYFYFEGKKNESK